MKSYHTASKQQLLSGELLNYQESVSQVCDRPCPFCQREFEGPIDLQQHIASHLESTALLSLPNLDNITEDSEPRQVNSNSANRNYAESRAGDFDLTEPLVCFENDNTRDTPMTDVSNELFGLKLDSKSVSFDSMNEVSLEAHQAYSSKLAEEWLSHLPHELSQESISLIEPLESSMSLNFDSEANLAIINLIHLCLRVYESCEWLYGDEDTVELRLLFRAVIKEIEELSHIPNLGQGLLAYVNVCADAVRDLERLTERFGMTNRWRTKKSISKMKGMSNIRSRLTSSLSEFRAFNKPYVESAHVSLRF